MRDKKSILLIILLVILLGFAIAYIILGPNGYKTTQKGKEFFDDVIDLQANLSYYVGASYSDSFGVYSKEEILLGKTLEDGEKIKDNEDNLLPTLVVESSAEEYGKDSKAYELNMEYVRTTLGVKTPDYEGIKFYVVDGDLLKVKLEFEPEWWNKNYDGLVIN